MSCSPFRRPMLHPQRGTEPRPQNSPAGDTRGGAGRALQRTQVMLVLTRKEGESIVIGENIAVTIVSVRGERIRLGISAPRDLPVHRKEVAEKFDTATPTA